MDLDLRGIRQRENEVRKGMRVAVVVLMETESKIVPARVKEGRGGQGFLNFNDVVLEGSER